MRDREALKSVCLLGMAIALTMFAPRCAAGADEDPPSRVARLAFAQGSVSFQPAGTDDWVTAGINRPMTTGDKIWADNDGRVELQLDGSFLRLANNTGFSFLNLSDSATQIQLTAGTLLVRVRRLDQNEAYEVDTPNLAFSVLRPGLYKISVDENRDSTFVTVRDGEGEVTGGGAAYSIHANDSYAFSGTDQLYASRADDRGEDQFESWSAGRDRHWENSRSVHYVSDEVVGYQDLDDYGSWRQTPDYGNVWFPRTSAPDWAPYHYGHWDYIEPWGYTWVDDEPWGFAPFHYGRWVNYQGGWGWVPAPPRDERASYERPVYAPALVAWVGGEAGATVAWFALGPREVYVPSYPVSRNYVNRVNVSNTTVNTTVVNNYYNTTVVNKTTNVTNVSYVNRSVPGAVAATTPQAFTEAQPVARNSVKVDKYTVASAPVRVVAPAIAPAKQAVLGTAPTAAKPPIKVQTRAVVAKVAPPPPLPSFEKRQAAIKDNGGKPLSAAQMRQIEPAAAHPHPAVKIAPAARPSTASPPVQPDRNSQPNNAPSAKAMPAPSNAPPPGNRPADRPPSSNSPNTKQNLPSAPESGQPESRPNDHPASPNNPNAKPKQPPAPNTAQPNRPPDRPAEHPVTPNNAAQPPHADRPPSAPPVHPNEQPPALRPAVPPSTNPAMDKQHQQEQEQLRAKQEQERQKLQQQQEQEHARAAQQEDQARKQQMEQQHQQQTQQQQQKHAQEQRQLDEKQQQQRQQQEKQKQQKQQPQKPEQPPQP